MFKPQSVTQLLAVALYAIHAMHVNQALMPIKFIALPDTASATFTV